MLDKILRLKAELDSLRPISLEDEAMIMQKFRLDWNYHSNNLEGNSLTYGETKALILFGITAQRKPLKDHFEITGHNEAIKWVEDIVKDKEPITENFIRQLHVLLLKEPYYVDAITSEGKPTKKLITPGQYKTASNHVKTKTGEIFRFATPEETPSKMFDLMTWLNKMLLEKNIDPVIIAAEFHYKFIRIHPFDDGNGRTARILMNLILMLNGYPPVIIKTNDKDNYFSALQQADAGIFEPFVQYIAKNLERSLEIMIKGAKGESIDEEDDIDKELALIDQKLKGIEVKTDIERSKQTILDLYENSLEPLIKKILEACKKFIKYYDSSDINYFYNDQTKYYSMKELKSFIGNQSNHNSLIIKISYNYFKNIDEQFNFHSTFEVSFNKYSYNIVNPHDKNIIAKKYYHELLSEDEINQIVKSESKRHTEAINKQLENLKKK